MMLFYYPGLGLHTPLPFHDNNGQSWAHRGEPPKDINSESGGDYAMTRQVYIRQTPIAHTVAPKKWMPNGNRDASSIAAKNRAIQMGQSAMGTPYGISYQTHSPNVNRNTIMEAKNRCRNKGYCAPPKIAASPSNTTTCLVGLPKPHLIKYDSYAYKESLYGDLVENQIIHRVPNPTGSYFNANKKHDTKKKCYRCPIVTCPYKD